MKNHPLCGWIFIWCEGRDFLVRNMVALFHIRSYCFLFLPKVAFAFSSTGRARQLSLSGSSPQTKKETTDLKVSCFFLVRRKGLEPSWLPTRPSNVRVCLFRHLRKCLNIITREIHYVKCFFRKNKLFFSLVKKRRV